jgi:hypothetical protein
VSRIISMIDRKNSVWSLKLSLLLPEILTVMIFTFTQIPPEFVHTLTFISASAQKPPFPRDHETKKLKCSPGIEDYLPLRGLK